MRRNSIVYRKQKKYKIADQMGLSAVTVGKYFKKAEDLGLLIQHHSDRIFIKLSECIKTLIPAKKFIQLRNVRFFKDGPYTSFKGLCNAIEFALLKNNLETQEFNINRKSVIDELGSNRLNEGSLSKLKRLAKEHGSCGITELLCICQRINFTVSGKFHLSNILGCSPTTASKRLRKWAKDRLIGRKEITKLIYTPCTYASFDFLKSQGYKYLIPFKDGTGFISNLGSAVWILR